MATVADYKRPVLLCLLSSLVLAACSVAGPQVQTPDERGSSTTPTTVAQATGTAVNPPSTPLATETPAASWPTTTPLSVASPTPSPQPTPSENATQPPAGAALLPPDRPWLLMGNNIVPIGGQAPGLQLLQPSHTGTIAPQALDVAHDGSLIVYHEGAELIVADPGSGEIRRYPQDGERLWTPRLAPDGRSVIYTVTFPENWEMQVLDLATGETRVLLGQPNPQPLIPVQWTADGIFAERIFLGSDAPVQGLFLVDPATGNYESVRPESYIERRLTSDGNRGAFVAGTRFEPPTSALSIWDRATNSETEVVLNMQGLIAPVSWSPDGTQLFYAFSPAYQTPPSWMAIRSVDGDNVQRLGDLPGRLQDAAWLAHDRLLLLFIAHEQTAHLYELPAAQFDPNNLKEIATLPISPDEAYSVRLIYLPR